MGRFEYSSTPVDDFLALTCNYLLFVISRYGETFDLTKHPQASMILNNFVMQCESDVSSIVLLKTSITWCFHVSGNRSESNHIFKYADSRSWWKRPARDILYYRHMIYTLRYWPHTDCTYCSFVKSDLRCDTCYCVVVFSNACTCIYLRYIMLVIS